METKKQNLSDLAEELSELLQECTKETAVRVRVEGRYIIVGPGETNTTGSFFHVGALADFARCKRLNCFIVARKGQVLITLYV